MNGGKVRIKLGSLYNMNIQGRCYLSLQYALVHVSGVDDNLLGRINNLIAVKDNPNIGKRMEEEYYSRLGLTHLYNMDLVSLDTWVSKVNLLVNMFRNIGVTDIAVNISMADIERWYKDITSVLSINEIATAIVYTLKQANFCEVMYKFALVDITHLEKVNGTLVLSAGESNHKKFTPTITVYVYAEGETKGNMSYSLSYATVTLGKSNESDNKDLLTTGFIYKTLGIDLLTDVTHNGNIVLLYADDIFKMAEFLQLLECKRKEYNLKVAIDTEDEEFYSDKAAKLFLNSTKNMPKTRLIHALNGKYSYVRDGKYLVG